VSRRHQQSLEPGQDSFLDVVANLVGILIILIAVIGVQAKQALIDQSPEVDDPYEEDATMDVEQRRVAARQMLESHQLAESSVETDIADKLVSLEKHAVELKFRQAERDRVQLLISAARRSVADQKSQLSVHDQRALEVNRDLALAQKEAAEIQQMVHDAQQAKKAPVVLQHLPTPMAKTVFGKEIHFRLAAGRIAYVPFDEMVEMLRGDAQRQSWKLKDAPAIEEQLGPVKGFRMNYRLVRRDISTPSQYGVVTQTGIELDRFQLQPVSDNLGEDVNKAMRNGSQMRDVLQANRPQSTTITIWVYPDSFGYFHELKHVLYDMGYLTAARPMPAGQPIGGSPRGTRSAAQ
jgi:hypothetical protein